MGKSDKSKTVAKGQIGPKGNDIVEIQDWGNTCPEIKTPIYRLVPIAEIYRTEYSQVRFETKVRVHWLLSFLGITNGWTKSQPEIFPIIPGQVIDQNWKIKNFSVLPSHISGSDTYTKSFRRF
jgi:hypothetical protein